MSNVAGSFAAEGLATQIGLADDPELTPAFEALDSGQTEQGLDLLIAAIAKGDAERKDELRKVVVGVLEELGSAASARA